MTGFYEPFRVNFNKLANIDIEKHVPFTSVAAGAVSGAVGGMISFLQQLSSLHCAKS
jgi:solute carrier family 25 protein 34/35